MTITTFHYDQSGDWIKDPITSSQPLDEVIIRINKQTIPAFKQLVQRALNTWADAPPELKEFGDLLEHNQVLQDYYSQK
jgi:hypothetical protein